MNRIRHEMPDAVTILRGGQCVESANEVRGAGQVEQGAEQQ